MAKKESNKVTLEDLMKNAEAHGGLPKHIQDQITAAAAAGTSSVVDDVQDKPNLNVLSAKLKSASEETAKNTKKIAEKLDALKVENEENDDRLADEISALKQSINDLDEEIANELKDKLSDTFGGVESILYSQLPQLGIFISGLKNAFSSIKKFADWQSGIGEKKTELQQMKAQLAELEESKKTNDKLDTLNRNVEAQSTLLRSNESVRLKERRIDLSAAQEASEESWWTDGGKVKAQSGGETGAGAKSNEDKGILQNVVDKLIDYYGVNDLGKLLEKTKLGRWTSTILKSLSPSRLYRLSKINKIRTAQGRTGPLPQFGRTASDALSSSAASTITRPVSTILNRYGAPITTTVSGADIPPVGPHGPIGPQLSTTVAAGNIAKGGKFLRGAKSMSKALGGKWALLDVGLMGLDFWSIAQQEKMGGLTKDQANKERWKSGGRGVGAMGMAAAGAGIGTMLGGPVGTVIGGLLGGALGAIGGEKIGEKLGKTFSEKNRNKIYKSVSNGLLTFYNGVIGMMFTPLKGFTTIAKFGEKLIRFAGKIMNPLNWGKRTYGELWDEADSESNRSIIGAADRLAGELQKNPVKGGIGAIQEFGRNVSTVGVTSAEGVGETGSSSEAMQYFQSQGWTKEQAAGIVGNLQAESSKNLKTNSVGDGGKAYGIAQWHPDRQKTFAQVMGKDIRQSTFKEQLAFVNWELNNSERSAGDELRQAKSPEEAAAIVDRSYERSTGESRRQRVANALALFGEASRKPKSAPASRAVPKATSAAPATHTSNPVMNAIENVGKAILGPWAGGETVAPSQKQQSVAPTRATSNPKVAAASSAPVIVNNNNSSVASNSNATNTSSGGALNKNLGDILPLLQQLDPDSLIMYG